MNKLKVNKLLALVILLVTLSFTPGCWDRKELEDLALVLAMGVDKGQHGGILVTLQIAIPRKLAGAQGGGDGAATVVTSLEAPGVIASFNLFNSYIGRRISLMQNRALVIGEELARDQIGMTRIVEPLTRYRETRRNMEVIVVKGTAMDFIKADQPAIDVNPAKYLEIIAGSSRYTGLIPQTSYNSFVDGLLNLGWQPFTILGASKPKPLKPKGKVQAYPSSINFTAANLPREGGEKVELMGTAVFRRDRMVGELTGAETRIFNMLTGNFKRAFMVFPETAVKGQVLTAVDMRQGSPPVTKVETKGDKPVIQVNLSLEGEILAIQGTVNYATDQALQLQLEKRIRGIIHTRSLALIKKTQQEYQSDIFGFGNYARSNFWTWPQWEAYDWEKKFPEAEIHVSVDFNIRRVGLVFAPSQSH